MKQILNKLLQRENLSSEEIARAGTLLVSGQLSEAQSAGFLMGLAVKGESVEEIVGLVKILRDNMKTAAISSEAIDTCGTGGDGRSTLNASTLSAIVCSASGVSVAKHGNRAISSRCGSFDLLEQFGVKIELSPEQAALCFAKTGLVFLFAPLFHPAFKHITPVRRNLGVRTIFNFLGPLLNPASVKRQVIGVAINGVAEKIGEALLRLGSERVLVVRGEDGLDEVSVAAPSIVYEFVRGEKARKFVIEPSKDFSLSDICGGDPGENKRRSLAILSGQGSDAENEFVALNAGLALYLAGAASTPDDGRKKALEILQSGTAAVKLSELIEVTNSFN